MKPADLLAPTQLSLRWKAFLVLLVVLAVVHGGLAYNGYLDLHEQYDAQVADDLAKYRTTLAGLFERARNNVDEQSRALAAVAAVADLGWAGELYFGFSAVRYYGRDGSELAEWRLTGLPRDEIRAARERAAAPGVGGSGRASFAVVCADNCVLEGLVPAFERAGREIVVATTSDLTPLLTDFRGITGAELALLEGAVEGAAPALWGRRIAAVTDAPRLLPLLREVPALAPAAGAQDVTAGDRSLLLDPQALPIAAPAGAQAVIIVDQTARRAAIAAKLGNYVAMTAFGMVLATAAIFILLTPSLRRLGHITRGLPLLAAQRFADAHRLFARAARRAGLSDEIDRLNDSAVTLARRLEQLMGAEAASEAKSQFLAAMSHEIRTPINGLLGLLELHEGTELDDSQRESVRIMRDSALTLLAVVDDILDFSKIEAGRISVDPVPMSLRDAVEGALEMLAATAASKGLRLMCYVDPALPAQVRADPVRLRQVLLNLCSNAIKFTARGSAAVTVSARPAAAGHVRVRCAVSDTGIGIAPEARDRLFKPFSQAEATTTRSYGGTGLGLSISRGLIERMGGTMGFTSTPGQGSEFWFELDCAVVAADAPGVPSLAGLAVHLDVADARERGHLQRYFESAGAQVEAAPRAGALRVEEKDHTSFRLVGADGREHLLGRPLRYLLLLREAAQLSGRTTPRAVAAGPAPRPAAVPRGRLLVAEDHPTNRRVIAQQLERLGFEAEVVEDGHQALVRLAQDTYRLLITDLHMPGLDGIALTGEIRRQEAAAGRPPLPIVALTADVLPAAVARCRAAGINEVLRKPIALDELGRALARLVPPAVDRGELARLLGTDDAALLRQTLDEFLRITTDHMAELRAAVRAADRDAVRRIAHRLSGSGRTVAAAELADAAGRLERAAQDGAADLAAPHQRVCLAFECVRRELAPAPSGAA